MSRAIGVDLGGTKMLIFAEVDGRPISHTVPTGRSCTPADLKRELASFVERLPFQPDAIGMAIPGLVESANRVVISNVLPLIAGMEADQIRPTAAPIYFLNDVKAALVEESSALHQPTIAVIMVGTGIGMGMMANGHFLNGCKGWAGELGSIPVATPGGVKTLDQVASGAGLIDTLQVDAPTIRQRLAAGDEATRRAVREAGTYFGLGLATVLQILNPQEIVLGGGTLGYDGHLEAALAAAQAHSLPDLWAASTIRPSQDPVHMVARGARRFAEAHGQVPGF